MVCAETESSPGWAWLVQTISLTISPTLTLSLTQSLTLSLTLSLSLSLVAFNAVNIGLFLWQVPTGLDIVAKVFQFTTLP